MLAPKLDPNDPVTAQLLRALEYKKKYCAIEQLFPDKGKFKRSLYKKHLEFFAAGTRYRQRMLMAGNRIGKTTAAGCELTYHLTGNYPKWWKGVRYNLPQEWWVCGKYSATVKDILQAKLLGPVGEFGSGIIPKEFLDLNTMTAAKKADTGITDFRVKHASGGYSQVGFRSYDQGRKAFEGTERCIWLDEEPPLDVYQECLMRTMTRSNGDGESMLIMTFTPLEGMSETVFTFLGEEGDYITEGEKGPGKFYLRIEMEDVPHLSEAVRIEILDSFPAYQREAREKGIPQLGAGVVYPVAPDTVFIDPISIPDHWKRCFAMDFGFKDPTAVLWAAVDPETERVYVYAEHYLADQPPMIHAAVVDRYSKLAGFVIPGVCDPSGGGSSTADGKHTREIYRSEYNLTMASAINSIEPGITTVLDALVTNKLKIFNTCSFTKKEFLLYRRNEKGKPIGADHAMDTLRYLMMSGTQIAKSKAQVMADKRMWNREYESRQEPEWAVFGF